MREVVRGILLNAVPSATGQLLNAGKADMLEGLLTAMNWANPGERASSTAEWDSEGRA